MAKFDAGGSGGGGGSDHKVLVDIADTTAGFLASKVLAGTNVTLTVGNVGANETITVNSAPTVLDHKVSVDASDTTPGFLAAKVLAGANVTLTVGNVGANETLTIAAPAPTTLDHKVSVSGTDTTPNFLSSKLAAGLAIALTVLGGGGNETLSASVSSLPLTNLTAVAGSTATGQFLQGNGAGVANSWGTLFTGPASPGDNGKLAIASSGDFTYALLTNANVSTTAAIAVTKLAASATNGQALTTIAGVPTWGTNFVAENITTVGNLILGTNPATTGLLRVANSSAMVGRNAANTANVTMIQVNGGNDITIGLGSGVTAPLTVTAASTNGLIINIGGVNQYTFSSIAFTSLSNRIVFDSTVINALVGMVGVASGSGGTITFTGCNTTAASQNGGLTIVSGGSSLNATPGLAGGLKLRIDENISNPTTMVELYQLAATRRIIALFGQTTTSTNMGANTGDYVLYVANAGTNPSADATNGFIQYSDAAKPAWRFNGTNFRLNGTSATANAGGGAALPVTVAGYLDVQVNGTQQKIPYYAA